MLYKVKYSFWQTENCWIFDKFSLVQWVTLNLKWLIFNSVWTFLIIWSLVSGANNMCVTWNEKSLFIPDEPSMKPLPIKEWSYVLNLKRPMGQLIWNKVTDRKQFDKWLESIVDIAHVLLIYSSFVPNLSSIKYKKLILTIWWKLFC